MKNNTNQPSHHVAISDFMMTPSPNCAELLELLGEEFYSHALANERRWNMTRWVLAHAMMEIDTLLPRMLAAVDYSKAEGFDSLNDYLESRVKLAGKKYRRKIRTRKAN